MLWLCLDFPVLGREALGVDAHTAVLATHGNHRWLITDTALPGSAQVLAAGSRLALARARAPDLVTRPRCVEAEREQLEALAHALYRFGSPVVIETLEVQEPYAVPRWQVAVEIGASLSLFGGVESLRQELMLMLGDWGCIARCGIAPTRSAAGLLAAAGETAPCLATPALAQRLSTLTIALLPWPAARGAALASVGFQRIGDLLALPRASLWQRFGAACVHDLDRLLGSRAEPFVAIEPPPVFTARFELHGEVEQIETLLFPLKRMTQRFAAYLSARAVTAMHCRLELRHDLGAPTVVPLQLLSPSRDATRWLEVLRERLYRAPPDRAVRELHLSASDFLPLAGAQTTLFDDHALSRERQALLEKLIARYGEQNLWQPALAADHRPERAMRQGALHASTPAELPAGRARRPLWLLPQVKAIPAPATEGLPERIETGWWDFAPARRDYYRVRLGERAAWVYRDLEDGRWHLQGLWG